MGLHNSDLPVSGSVYYFGCFAAQIDITEEISEKPRDSTSKPHVSRDSTSIPHVPSTETASNLDLGSPNPTPAGESDWDISTSESPNKTEDVRTSDAGYFTSYSGEYETVRPSTYRSDLSLASQTIKDNSSNQMLNNDGEVTLGGQEENSTLSENVTFLDKSQGQSVIITDNVESQTEYGTNGRSTEVLTTEPVTSRILYKFSSTGGPTDNVSTGGPTESLTGNLSAERLPDVLSTSERNSRGSESTLYFTDSTGARSEKTKTESELPTDGFTTSKLVEIDKISSQPTLPPNNLAEEASTGYSTGGTTEYSVTGSSSIHHSGDSESSHSITSGRTEGPSEDAVEDETVMSTTENPERSMSARTRHNEITATKASENTPTETPSSESPTTKGSADDKSTGRLTFLLTASISTDGVSKELVTEKQGLNQVILEDQQNGDSKAQSVTMGSSGEDSNSRPFSTQQRTSLSEVFDKTMNQLFPDLITEGPEPQHVTLHVTKGQDKETTSYNGAASVTFQVYTVTSSINNIGAGSDAVVDPELTPDVSLSETISLTGPGTAPVVYSSQVRVIDRLSVTRDQHLGQQATAHHITEHPAHNSTSADHTIARIAYNTTAHTNHRSTGRTPLRDLHTSEATTLPIWTPSKTPSTEERIPRPTQLTPHTSPKMKSVGSDSTRTSVSLGIIACRCPVRLALRYSYLTQLCMGFLSKRSQTPHMYTVV